MKESSLYEKFYLGALWNFSGSIFYESIKILHQLFLFRVLAISLYGQIGVVFSMMFLTINLSQFGFSDSIPPFVSIFTRNKSNFKSLLFKYILVQLPILFIGGFLSFLYLSSRINISPWIYISMIIFGGIRMFFRLFLHTVFLSKSVVLTESTLILSYILLIWIPFLFLSIPITVNRVIAPYLLTSAIVVFQFLFITMRYYKKLPLGEKAIPPNLLFRIIKARFFNYSISLSKIFFTSNFLIPFLGSRFGMAQAGIFKLSSYLSDAIQAISHSTIGFSGGALLATIKEGTLKEKKSAFKNLSKTLNDLLIFLFVLLAFNYKHAFSLISANQPRVIVASIIVFFILSMMQNLFVAYDQFYIVEERNGSLMLFKVLELFLFCITIMAPISSSLYVLCLLLLVRVLSFIIISINGYKLFGIIPYFKIEPRLILGYSILSFFISKLINFML